MSPSPHSSLPSGPYHVRTDGEERGPMPLEQVLRGISLGRVSPHSQLHTPQWGEWRAVSSLPELMARFNSDSPAGKPETPPHASSTLAHVIHGEEMQYVEVLLEPGQQCYSDPDALLYVEPGITLEPTALLPEAEQGGFVEQLNAVLARQMGGESGWVSVFRNQDVRRRRLALRPEHPGRVFALELSEGYALLASPGAFFAASTTIQVTLYQGHDLAWLTGQMQLISGAGTLFMTANGALLSQRLEPGEELFIPLERLVCFSGRFENCRFESFVHDGSRFTNMLRLAGPAQVWLHTGQPFYTPPQPHAPR